MVRLIVPDKLTAMTAAQAITAALLARERTGKGQHVRLSMLDAMVSFLWPEGMTAHTLVGDGVGNRKRGSLADLIYETKDGYITVSTMTNTQWEAFCRTANREHLLEDREDLLFFRSIWFFDALPIEAQHLLLRAMRLLHVRHHAGLARRLSLRGLHEPHAIDTGLFEPAFFDADLPCNPSRPITIANFERGGGE